MPHPRFFTPQRKKRSDARYAQEQSSDMQRLRRAQRTLSTPHFDVYSSPLLHAQHPPSYFLLLLLLLAGSLPKAEARGSCYSRHQSEPGDCDNIAATFGINCLILSEVKADTDLYLPTFNVVLSGLSGWRTSHLNCMSYEHPIEQYSHRVELAKRVPHKNLTARSVVFLGDVTLTKWNITTHRTDERLTHCLGSNEPVHVAQCRIIEHGGHVGRKPTVNWYTAYAPIQAGNVAIALGCTLSATETHINIAHQFHSRGVVQFFNTYDFKTRHFKQDDEGQMIFKLPATDPRKLTIKIAGNISNLGVLDEVRFFPPPEPEEKSSACDDSNAVCSFS